MCDFQLSQDYLAAFYPLLIGKQILFMFFCINLLLPHQSSSVYAVLSMS